MSSKWSKRSPFLKKEQEELAKWRRNQRAFPDGGNYMCQGRQARKRMASSGYSKRRTELWAGLSPEAQLPLLCPMTVGRTGLLHHIASEYGWVRGQDKGKQKRFLKGPVEQKIQTAVALCSACIPFTSTGREIFC